jgi:hypothetical protein
MMAKGEQQVKPKKERTKEEQRLAMKTGEQDEEVYTEAGRDELVENDEIDTWEEGFMEGAEGRGQMTSCARCGKLLGQGKTKIFGRKINGKKMLFCSKEHAEKGPRD